jgi:hypothetical protein
LVASLAVYGSRHRKKVEEAAYIVLTERDGKDPFQIDNHVSLRRGNPYDCPEPSIWDEDSDEQRLIDEAVISETEVEPGFNALECPACNYTYYLWQKLIEASKDDDDEAGTVEYGQRVFSALSLIRYLEDFKPDVNELSLDEWNDVQIVRGKLRQIEEHHRYLSWLNSQPKSNVS